MQDAAYDSLLKSVRQALHASIARVLEADFPKTADIEPELLAHHLTGAGEAAAAIPYWQKAGHLAIKRQALQEAIAHLNRGMEILGTLPPSSARDHQEVDLRTPLGMAWLAYKGWSAPEVRTNLHPALDLAKSLERHDALLPIYYGLWSAVITNGRLVESLTRATEMLATAESIGDSNLLVVAHQMMCVTYCWLGDLIQTRAHGAQVMALYRGDQHRHLVDLMSIDPSSMAALYRSISAWMLGYPDQAREIHEISLADARRRNHPFDLGYSLTTGWVLELCGEFSVLLTRTEESEVLGRVHRLPIIELIAQTIKGLALVRAGRNDEGVPRLRDRLKAWQAQGNEAAMPYWRAVLAEGLAMSGDIEESLVQIARPGWEERLHLAEILRLKGWMLSLQGDLDGAAQSYQSSLAWAREQQAKSWELAYRDEPRALVAKPRAGQ